MSEFAPVRTKDELNLLDEDEMVAGYRAGFGGAAEPGSDRSRSFWHGWRNGRVDGKHDEIDHHQIALAREVVGRYRGLN
jgi:hypothetical protein